MNNHELRLLLDVLDHLHAAVESLKDTVIHIYEGTYIDPGEKEMAQLRLNDCSERVMDVGFQIDNLRESINPDYILPSTLRDTPFDSSFVDISLTGLKPYKSQRKKA